MQALSLNEHSEYKPIDDLKSNKTPILVTIESNLNCRDWLKKQLYNVNIATLSLMILITYMSFIIKDLQSELQYQNKQVTITNQIAKDNINYLGRYDILLNDIQKNMYKLNETKLWENFDFCLSLSDKIELLKDDMDNEIKLMETRVWDKIDHNNIEINQTLNLKISYLNNSMTSRLDSNVMRLEYLN
jgi:hypothetical protein